MITPVTKEIDGFEFTFTPLMVTPARESLDRLLNRFGPTVASALEGFKISKGSGDSMKMLEAMASSLGGGVRGFCQGLEPKYHKELIEKFFTNVTYKDGEKDVPLKSVMELLFATKILTETKVLVWCLEEQYSDFFGLLKQELEPFLAKLKVVKKQHLESQKK